MLLVDLMQRYSLNSAKYGSIYNFLKELMEGKYPSKLTAYDSIVFLSLIDTLTSFIENQNLATFKESFLQLYTQLNEQLRSKQIKKGSDNELEYLSYFQQIEPNKLKTDIQLATSQLSSSSNLLTQQNNQQSNQQVNLSKNQNPLYQYSQLPRIQKIKECFNPLGISVGLISDLYSSISQCDKDSI